MLLKKNTNPLLEKWLGAEISLPSNLESILESLRINLLNNAEAWNEDELKFFFISPVISFVKYDSSPEKFKPFTQRPLSLVIPEKQVETSGRVEFMLAKGDQTPTEPYFCLHEYKQESKKNSDPRGQLLISMIASQYINKTPMPIYGCYVIGRFWFFIVLEKNEYALSSAYDATKISDLLKIYSILSEVKSLVEPYV